MKTRKTLQVGEPPSNPGDLATWSAEQIRLASAWANHEEASRYDALCAPYDWVPGWIGNLTSYQVAVLCGDWYNRQQSA